MFRTLLRKEFAYQVLSGRLLIALALFLILIPLSSILLLEEQERQLEEVKVDEQNAKGLLEWLAEQTDPNRRFDAYAAAGVTVARRPPPLSFVAKGFDPAMPRRVRATTKASKWQVTTLETDKPTNVELENPILARFPVADTVYIVTVIGALLAIFVSFDAVCREREAGTLKLLFANPVRRGTVLLAKWWAALLSVGIGLVVATLVVVSYVIAARRLVLTGEVLWRWGTITALGLLYLAFFCAVGVLISTLASTRRVSLMIGLVAWLLFVLVAPGITSVVAQSAVPLPERPRVKALWKEYSDGIRGRRDVPVMGDMKDLVPEDEEKLRLVAVHERQAEKQRRLFEVISRVTPAASYICASTELAGTGASYYDGFRRADQRLADDFRAYVIRYRPDARAKQMKPEDVDMGKLPAFAGMPTSGKAALSKAAKDLAALLIETLAVLVVSMFLFVRTAEL